MRCRISSLSTDQSTAEDYLATRSACQNQITAKPSSLSSHATAVCRESSLPKKWLRTAFAREPERGKLSSINLQLYFYSQKDLLVSWLHGREGRLCLCQKDGENGQNHDFQPESVNFAAT
jgi:hypothetical protein